MEQKFYKKLENNIPTGNLEIRSNIQSCHPGKNLDDMDVLAELGYCIYYHTPEPSNLNLAKKYVSSDTEIESGVWKNSWSLEDVELDSEEQRAENLRIGFAQLRANRNYYLQLTDHYALSDGAEMTDEIRAYRQALRDLPSNTTDPWNVTWPIDPTDPDGTKY